MGERSADGETKSFRPGRAELPPEFEDTWQQSAALIVLILKAEL
jgi:hypothetical protein